MTDNLGRHPRQKGCGRRPQRQLPPTEMEAAVFRALVVHRAELANVA
jgi:hypothetical protein